MSMFIKYVQLYDYTKLIPYKQYFYLVNIGMTKSLYN